MRHGSGQGLLVLVPAGLEIVYELEVHPARYPVPVQVVDDDVLLHDALVVVAPGYEGDVIPAPLAQLLQSVGKGDAVGQPLLDVYKRQRYPCAPLLRLTAAIFAPYSAVEATIWPPAAP